MAQGNNFTANYHNNQINYTEEKIMAKGRLIFTKGDGYMYERDGKTYALLEGKTIGANATSDLCFVMETDENGYKDFAGWFCIGSADSNPNELLKSCDTYVFDESPEHRKLVNATEEIKKLKEENEQLKKLLLQMEKKTDTEDIKVTRKQFCDFRDIAEQLMFNGTEDEGERFGCYGKDVTVHWNGMYCNCEDGAAPSNYIFPAILELDEECDDE